MNANVVLGIMAAMMVGMIVMTIGMISVLRQFNELVRVLEETENERLKEGEKMSGKVISPMYNRPSPVKAVSREEHYQYLGLRFGQGLDESIETIKELIDKETSLKPYHSENGYRRCGRCHLILKSTNGVPFRYCSYCGQRVGRGNE